MTFCRATFTNPDGCHQQLLTVSYRSPKTGAGPASAHHDAPQFKLPDVEVLLPTFGFDFVEIAFDLYPTSIG